jgi:hypothetical protein
MVTREGTRPLLVEVQALVDASPLSNPRRVAVGLEQNRLAMCLAVLHRHGGIGVSDQDVFVNVVGGIRLQETAADLPVLLAVLSSLRDTRAGRTRQSPSARSGCPARSAGAQWRGAPAGAATHGFKRAIVPKANAPKSGSYKGLEVIALNDWRMPWKRRLTCVEGQCPAAAAAPPAAFAANGGLAIHTKAITTRNRIPSRWKISLKPICAACCEIIWLSTIARVAGRPGQSR